MGITMPVTKQNYKVKDPKKLVATMREAFEIAHSGRPGPVLVDIPRDVFFADVSFALLKKEKKKRQKPDADFLICAAEAADVMLAAKRPLVIAGGGIISAGASREFTHFVEKYHFPVATTLMGMSPDGVPALSATSDDVPENVNPSQVVAVSDLIAELIRRS